jgi:hypothetical protein
VSATAPPETPKHTEAHIAALSFDSDGTQLAAFLDLKSFIHVWNLAHSWRHNFMRGVIPLGCSHRIPCVPSAVLTGGVLHVCS